MESLSKRLKPCPFCGGEGRPKLKYSYGTRGGQVWGIRCRNCGVERGSCFGREEAVEVWNRRDYSEIIEGLEMAYECTDQKELISGLISAVKECEHGSRKERAGTETDTVYRQD